MYLSSVSAPAGLKPVKLGLLSTCAVMFSVPVVAVVWLVLLVRLLSQAVGDVSCKLVLWLCFDVLQVVAVSWCFCLVNGNGLLAICCDCCMHSPNV